MSVPSTAVETAIAWYTSCYTMARGHRLNISIVLAAVHGLFGARGRAFTLSPPPPPSPPPSPSLISILASVDVKQNVYGFRCQIPAMSNDTYVIQDDRHRALVNKTVPEDENAEHGYAQCTIFKDWNDTKLINGTRTRDVVPCDAWVYDWTEFDSSFITQVVHRYSFCFSSSVSVCSETRCDLTSLNCRYMPQNVFFLFFSFFFSASVSVCLSACLSVCLSLPLSYYYF